MTQLDLPVSHLAQATSASRFACATWCGGHDLLQHIEDTQVTAYNQSTQALRKQLGQFFTSSHVASYMASFIKPVRKSVVRLLDAGAGLGMLTIAAALQALHNGDNVVHAVVYEIDPDLTDGLVENLTLLTQLFNEHNASFSFEVRTTDFVLTRPVVNSMVW